MRKIFTYLGIAFAMTATALTASAVTYIPINWDETVKPGSFGQKYYSFEGKGTAAKIVTNEDDANNDFTMGGQTFLKKGSQEIDVTAVLDGTWVYTTPVLENGATYTIEFFCPGKDFEFILEEVKEGGEGGGTDTPVKEPEEIFSGKKDLLQDQVYFYKATANGTILITNEYSPDPVEQGNIIYTNVEHTTPLEGVKIGSNGGYPSYEFEVVEGTTYYIYFNTTNYITATITFTAAPEPEVNELTWDVEGEVEPGKSYTITCEAEQGYIVTDLNENLVENDYLQLWWGTVEDNDKQNLMAVAGESGFSYNIKDNLQNTSYTLVVSANVSQSFHVTFKSGQAEVPPVALTVDADPINLISGTLYYYEATEDGKIQISTETDKSYLEGQNIVFSDEACHTPVNVIVGSDSNYSCSFDVEKDQIYYISFNYPLQLDNVTLAFEEPVVTPKYMQALPQVYFDNDANDPALFLIWNETLDKINEDEDLTGTLTVPKGIEVPVTLTITTYYEDVEDAPGIADDTTPQLAPDNALILKMGEYISEYGYGNYTLAINSIVMNAKGEWNQPVEDAIVTVEEPEGLSEVQATIVVSGDEIIISWENETIQYYNPYDDDIQIIKADQSEEAIRLNTSKGVEVTENSVVISLEGLTIDEDVEYEVIVPEKYVKIGSEELGNEMVDDTIIIKASGISSIETNLSNGEIIYNLQGVKVQNPVKGAIYIINGKKVVM